jgi:hypothetical protein
MAACGDSHRLEVIEADGGLARGRCSCGSGGGGRWHSSPEQAQKAADRHLAKASRADRRSG